MASANSLTVAHQLEAVLSNTWSEDPPEGTERVQLSVRLPIEYAELVAQLAGVLEISRSELMSRLLIEGLEPLRHYSDEVVNG